ncbi:MAG: PadR family transcriptional regulator [Ignavibacteria bacterium]|jgi:DNA-binding PadR family transcriptional regulator
MKFLSRAEELLLLALWKITDEPYGVNIRQYVSDITGKYWSIGAIYVPLDRLENKGYVESYLANPTPERGGKSKRYYKITNDGLEALREIQRMNSTLWGDMPDLSTEKL